MTPEQEALAVACAQGPSWTARLMAAVLADLTVARAEVDRLEAAALEQQRRTWLGGVAS